jgi:hypothetical protein
MEIDVKLKPTKENIKWYNSVVDANKQELNKEVKTAQIEALLEGNVRLAMKLESLQNNELTIRLADDDSLKVPAGVQANARRALEWIKDGKAGSNFTSVGRARAKQLASGGPVSKSVIKRMYSYFSRHQVDKSGEGFKSLSDPSPGRVAWDAWGGDAGFAWVKKLVKKWDKAETKMKKKATLEMLRDYVRLKDLEDQGKI